MSDPSKTGPTSTAAGPWQRTLNTLNGLLFDRGEVASPSMGGLRVSMLGHTLLTGGIVLMAAAGFAISQALTRASVHQWDLCNHSRHGGATEALNNPDAVVWLRLQQAQQATISALPVATVAQRQRLLEQRQEILETMNSYCLISHNFQIQFTAFTSVGTAAAILVTISLITVAPDGLKTRNRTLLNVLMTSGIVLAICVIYPQTFSHIANEARAVSVYQQASNLLRSFNSTLANEQISSSEQDPRATSPLKSPEAIATFIRANDIALGKLTAARLSFNNRFATETLNQLNIQPGAAASPAAASSDAPALLPSAPAPVAPSATAP